MLCDQTAHIDVTDFSVTHELYFVSTFISYVSVVMWLSYRTCNELQEIQLISIKSVFNFRKRYIF